MLEKLISEAVGLGASDIHLTEGLSPMLRINGRLRPLTDRPPMNADSLNISVRELLGDNYNKYTKKLYYDFSFSVNGYRLRGHAYRQKGFDAITLRTISAKIPSIKDLNLPDAVRRFVSLRNGLVLVTGTTGSGKSTTLASLIDEINRTQQKHIVTVEDPIEYIHKHNGCMINQREAGVDTHDFAEAVKSAMREDPDVLLVGEMRDLETIGNTITMAETGHLVFATLHTKSAAETIDRIIDVFPASQQQQVRFQLSSVLEGIISQSLLPKKGGGRVPACEILVVNDAIRSLIREKSAPAMIVDQIHTNRKKMGCQTHLQSLADLCAKDLIDYNVAMENAGSETEFLMRMLKTASG